MSEIYKIRICIHACMYMYVFSGMAKHYITAGLGGGGQRAYL